MRVIFCAYREWALQIFKELDKLPHNFLLIKSPEDLTFSKCKNFKPDLILFYGWSWIIGDKYLSLAPSVCLHPSPLPKYRGGSPIQNQIINGEKTSAVTLFYMSNKIDAGDIISQKEISFEGHLQDILDRIVDTGIQLTTELLNGNMNGIPQDESNASYFKRRQPHQSELKADDFKNKTAEELYNIMRALEDPYPNAFIRCKDGSKLLFKRVEISENLSEIDD
ncbi:MAG: hypothetical protein K8R74_05685 [Bacteroidales bacterium]|nr:hypothetical protein [Bacteroidales bacterium]